MANNKRRKHKQNRTAPPPPPPPATGLRFLIKQFGLMWKALFSAIGILATVVGLYSFFASDISIVPVSPADPNNTFSTPFLLTSKGRLDLNDVLVRFHFDNAIDTGMNTWNNINPAINSYEKIEYNHPVTIDCGNFIGTDMPFKKGDVDISISYRPSFLPFRKSPEIFRFFVERGTDGTTHWRQR